MVGGRRKKVAQVLKLQIAAGQATPAPPVGPALGQAGINIMDFCKQYNAETQQNTGTIVPVEITVYEDRSFSFITKTPPAAVLLRQKAGVACPASIWIFTFAVTFFFAISLASLPLVLWSPSRARAPAPTPAKPPSPRPARRPVPSR